MNQKKKITAITKYIPIITLKENGVNSPIKQETG
jgi:hypothetical protein